jgi:transposase InsO family protein
MELKEYTKELQAKALKNFPRRPVETSYPNDIWGADLLDVSKFKVKNKNITFLLVIIDIFSRYVYVLPLKNKEGLSVLEAFKTLKIVPDNLWVDEGREFYNSEMRDWCKEKNINMYHTYSGLKSVYAERFNRTLRDLMFEYMNGNNVKNYLEYLPTLIKKYNETIHKSLNETPSNVYNNSKEPKHKIYVQEKEQKLKIGDYVRISKSKKIFEKGYTPKWSSEVFKIIETDDRDLPIMYVIEDLFGEKIEGKFYSQELSISNIKDFKVFDKLVERKTINKKKMVLISYEGLPKKYDTWVTNAQYLKIVG